jgi:ribosomal protein L11 methyltransferase
VAASDAEAACDALRALVAGGAWIEQPFSQHDLESEAQIDSAAPAIVRAYVPADRANGVAGEARAALAEASVSADVSTRAVDEEDWAESWKEHFHVERFGERIVVVPSWRTYDHQPDDVVIALDPGMAFGTGQHETTRMCLEALERVVAPGMRVLDVGCGSGILAIAAAKLGARDVVAVDVDVDCVRITRENAELNGVYETVAAEQGSVGAGWPFEDPPSGFDVVVANIIARVIIEHAPALLGALAAGGRLIVSGIIAEREAETCEALAAAGEGITSVRVMGEWRCIEAERA